MYADNIATKTNSNIAAQQAARAVASSIMRKRAIQNELRPAATYPIKQFPNLRRMTDAPVTGCLSTEYNLTPKGARIVEDLPELLLHNLLYNYHEGLVFVYRHGGQNVGAVLTQKAINPESLDKTFIEQVNICAPEELAPNVDAVRVNLACDYPARFLPFDLNRIKSGIENELAGGGQPYKFAKFPESIYFGSCPLSIYQAFHYLTRLSGEASKKMAGIRRVLDIGSGLGIISFIISQLLAKDALIDGIEINPVLKRGSEFAKDIILRLGYNVNNVSFREGNILAGASIDYDALIGWFPLGHDVTNSDLLKVFKKLKKGSLVFEVYCNGPLNYDRDLKEYGFRRVEVDFPLQVAIFERT